MDFTSTSVCKPGDILSGSLKYNIKAQQETILDARIHFNGSVLVHPTKTKYEAHRKNEIFIEESKTLFQGPFTLKQQVLEWPFSFTLPAMSIVDNSLVPLPPSMDQHFREGLEIRVEYSITATIRLGSKHSSTKQETKVVLVKPPLDPTMLADHTATFPPIELQSKDLSNHSRLKFWNKTNPSKIGSPVSRHTLQLEMKLPATLSQSRQDTITCTLKTTSEDSAATQYMTFVLEVCELVLRCHSRFHDLLEEVQHIGTVILRPGVHLKADGQSVTIPYTIGLRDFTRDRRTPSSLDSYDSFSPKVSQESMLTVAVILTNKINGHHMHTKLSLPIVVYDAAARGVPPPAYNPIETLDETIPPTYGS